MFGMSAYSPVSLTGAYASHLLFHAKQTHQKERGGVGDKGSGVWQRARGCSQEEMVCSSGCSLPPPPPGPVAILLSVAIRIDSSPF